VMGPAQMQLYWAANCDPEARVSDSLVMPVMYNHRVPLFTKVPPLVEPKAKGFPTSTRTPLMVNGPVKELLASNWMEAPLVCDA
jgi:hypothetical protein